MAQVAAIVLAAGASSRFGSPKQFIRLGGETLLERAVRVVSEAGLSPIYGVISNDFSHESVPYPMISVVNPQAIEGIASSIRCGIRAVENVAATLSGSIILACDQPAVTVEHLKQLALGGPEVLASAYAGRKGIPAYFPKEVLRKLLALRGDTGAREFLKAAKAIDLPAGELDIDTIEDLDRARKFYET
jgi:molybdenum cofactor cytidylyltransferase